MDLIRTLMVSNSLYFDFRSQGNTLINSENIIEQLLSSKPVLTSLVLNKPRQNSYPHRIGGPLAEVTKGSTQ
jgi:hypothetical protein